MTTPPNNPPAFPRPVSVTSDGKQVGGGSGQEGMTLRDWFAGQALHALIQRDNHVRISYTEMETYYDIAPYAYRIADEMLKERQNPDP